MSNVPPASAVNEWFPPERQTLYIENLLEKKAPHLTRKQATYFVRLWGYGCLKDSSQQLPIKTLSRTVKKFSCSYREAAGLFYCDRHEGGSERAAGMILKTLAKKKLVMLDKHGNEETVLRLKIPPLPDFLLKAQDTQETQFEADTFNVEEDVFLVASFLAEIYPWAGQRPKNPAATIDYGLRQWATQYPRGLRVLRKNKDRRPVGFAAFFPVDSKSREKVFESPRASMYLCSPNNEDPVKLASPGDENCRAVFIRSWTIRWDYWNDTTLCQFVRDTQATLRQMKEEFPRLSEVYAISIHPRLEALALALGFELGEADSEAVLCWLFSPLRWFLELDVEQVLLEFDARR